MGMLLLLMNAVISVIPASWPFMRISKILCWNSEELMYIDFLWILALVLLLLQSPFQESSED